MKPPKQKRRLLRAYPHLWMQAYWPVYLVCFFALERWGPAPRYWVHCALDDAIPFCEWFVLPYCSWFVMLAFALFYLWTRDTQSYDRLCALMFGGMSLCLLIYLILPNGLALRPAGPLPQNPAARLLGLLWAADTPTNVCPSIHCQSTGCMVLALSRSRPLRGRLGWQAAVWVWGALICLSTLFTKQHSAVDVLLGLAMAAPGLWVFGRGRACKTRGGI